MDSAKTKQYIDKHFDAAFLDPLKVYNPDCKGTAEAGNTASPFSAQVGDSCVFDLSTL